MNALSDEELDATETWFVMYSAETAIGKQSLRLVAELRAARVEVERLTEANRQLVEACTQWAGEDMPDGQTLLPRRVAAALAAVVLPEPENEATT